MSVVYPQFVRPIPSMSVVEFQLDQDKGKVTTGFPIARGSTLYSRPVNGVPCKFRTCYDTTLWPVELSPRPSGKRRTACSPCPYTGDQCRRRFATGTPVPARRDAAQTGD